MSLALLLVIFSPVQHPMVEWKAGEIWLTREGMAAMQLTHDGCEKSREPLWSPDGTKIAYYTNKTVDRPQCRTEIVLLAPEGTRLKSFPALDRGNAVTGLEWLGNDQIGIDTHINPSVGQYRVVGVKTGKEIASFFGYGFRSSPDSKHIAHAGSVPHFAPPFTKSDYLMVDDKVVYPSHAGEQPNLRSPDLADRVLFRDIHEFRTDFAWSPDGTRIALIERLFDWRGEAIGSYDGREENDRWQLVIVQAAGGAAERKRLSEVGGGAVTIQWTDANHLNISGGGVSREYAVPE